jgi:hypothetical protein
VAIAALVVWLLTAAAGVMLVTGQAARRSPATGPAGAPSPGGPPPSGPAPARPGPASSGPARPGPVSGPAPTSITELPPIPRVTVHADPGDHPLLEFSHPALGLIGFGLWFVFVGTHYHPLAWVAFGVLVVGAGAGLRWLAGNTRAARRSPGGARPAGAARHGGVPRLAILHGLAAGSTLVLVVLTALAASHG